MKRVGVLLIFVYLLLWAIFIRLLWINIAFGPAHEAMSGKVNYGMLFASIVVIIITFWLLKTMTICLLELILVTDKSLR